MHSYMHIVHYYLLNRMDSVSIDPLKVKLSAQATLTSLVVMRMP